MQFQIGGELVLTISLLFVLHEAVGSVAEKELIRHLLNEDNHNPAVRPVLNSTESLNVTIKLYLYQLIRIDEKDQQIHLSAWLSTKWSDYQLQWNPAEYNDIHKINLRHDNIWVPDIVLYNNIDDSNSEYGGNMDTLLTRVKVYHDGQISWNTPLIIKASCKIKVVEFPYDTQYCDLKFGSWTHILSEINLLSGGIDTGNYMQNSAWNVKETETVVDYPNFTSGIYPAVTFHLHFQRKSMFYATNLIFPMAIITLLTIITFILPSESGERIGLSVTLMLAATVFMLFVAETTPESSEGLPLASVYFIYCMILMFLIIVALCYISRMYNKGRTDRPMSQWTRGWILDSLSYTIGIRHHSSSQRNEKPKPGDGFVNEGYNNSNGNVGSILRRLSLSSSMNSVDIKELEVAIQRLETNDVKQYGGSDVDDACTFEEEWRIVAMTADRVLFVIFLILFFVGTIACYAPTQYVV